ncbi:hypothetical protein Tco_1004668 [Tanacetum coccineum]|uniref:Uncharacterized protein n=1 Tax=Tanacetum coccineum TaxID=301880 RepID=A0ABQ5FCP9_9ASTR
MNGLEAYDGEINLALDENLISNEYAVKLSLDYEVKKGNKVVKKELIVALKGELYFVKFIINPKEDDVEPGVIFGMLFMRLVNGIVDFGSGVIIVYPEVDPFEDDYEKTEKNIRTSSLTRRNLTQEEAAKEALALRVSQKFALLEKVKGEALKEKDDPGAFIFPIRLEGKINENTLAGTGSDKKDDIYTILDRGDAGVRSVSLSEKVEGHGDWNAPEYMDTSGSKEKKVKKALSFYKMETDEVSERYIAPCFVNGLDAYNGEINLAFDDNLISNKYAVKLCLDYEEDDEEPGVIFGRSFIRLVSRIVDFGSAVITVYPIRSKMILRRQKGVWMIGISYLISTLMIYQRWDTTGFKYKHDYTIIETSHAVVFPVGNNERKIMRLNEIYKFSDGTLTNILEALDYRVKEYKTMGGNDDEAGSSRSKCSRQFETVEEFIMKPARKSRVLSDEVLRSLSALIYCRDLDTTTLRVDRL